MIKAKIMKWKKYFLENKFFCVNLLINTILFFLNQNHDAQQGIYRNVYIPLANTIINNFSYTLIDTHFDTYPMWGYPIILSFFGFLGIDFNNIILLQYVLLVVSLILFNKIYITIKNIPNFVKIIIFCLFIFYSAILSVKWPDAIIAFLFFMFTYYHIQKKYLYASFMLGLSYNFRTEYIIFLFVYVIFIIYKYNCYKQIVSLLFIVPYILVNIFYHNTLILTTTNSGGVLYISLGQLPNNPWNREHKDEEAYNYIQKITNGRIKEPWGYEANKYLTKQFIEDIKTYPFAFVKKILYNFLKSMIGGFYSYEFSLLFLNKKEYEKISKFSKDNIIVAIKYLITIEKKFIIRFIDFCFSLLSKIVLLLTFYVLVKTYNQENILLYLFFILQILLLVLIQYEPRHMSKIIGIFILVLVLNNNNRLKIAEA